MQEGVHQACVVVQIRRDLEVAERGVPLGHGLEEVAATIHRAAVKFLDMVTVFDDLAARGQEIKKEEETCDLQVEKIIKATGFFRTKARRIIAASRTLVEQFGGEVPPRMEDLVKVPGIGRKTANVILGAGFGIPGFAVDTHVTRLSNRLGLVKTRVPEKIEAQVTRMVPSSEWTALSLRLILHGRRVCVARRPRCEECVLNDFCPSSCTRPKPRRTQK